MRNIPGKTQIGTGSPDIVAKVYPYPGYGASLTELTQVSGTGTEVLQNLNLNLFGVRVS